MNPYIRARTALCVLGAVLVLAFVPVSKANGQNADSLSQVKKVFVGSLGDKDGAIQLRDALIKALRKRSDIQIVATAGEADAIIVGEGKIWVTGTMNFEIQGELLQKAYDGYLQAELIGKGDKTLWSDRVTPSKFPWNGIVRDLAGNLAKNLKHTLR